MITGPLLLGAALAAEPALDLSHSNVVASSTLLAMGGAGVAMAAGSGGISLNPASPGHRPAHRMAPLIWDLHGRIGRDGWYGSDVSNLGEDEPWVSVTGSAGLSVSAPRFGAGLLVRGFSARSLPERDRRMDFGDLRLAGATRLGASPLTVGAGLTVAAGWLEGAEALDYVAPGVSMGLIADWADLGLHAAAVIETSQRDGNVPKSSGVQSVVVPARGAVGVAWASEVLPTPLDRHPLLLAADLVVLAPVQDGVVPEAWLEGVIRPRGETTTLSPRFGAELEAVPDQLRLRAGAYRDPGRAQGATPRWHGTGGAELRTVKIRLRGESMYVSVRNGVDLAHRYVQVQLLGLSFWHPNRVAASPPR